MNSHILKINKHHNHIALLIIISEHNMYVGNFLNGSLSFIS